MGVGAVWVSAPPPPPHSLKANAKINRPLVFINLFEYEVTVFVLDSTFKLFQPACFSCAYKNIIFTFSLFQKMGRE
jgi:hypothetical protein